MDTAYLHLVTNHIPIIGVPFAIALLALGLWRKSDELKLAAFLAFVAIGVATIGVYLLGQGGEDFVEDLAGVSHDSIEEHEGAATFGLILVLATALPAAFALVRYRLLQRDATFPRWIALTTLVLALASAATLGYVGRLGGKIRHTEFHGGAAANAEAERDAEERDEEGKGRGRNRGR
jgi:drug/metabolite transporter (DMT)-like permease